MDFEDLVILLSLAAGFVATLVAIKQPDPKTLASYKPAEKTCKAPNGWSGEILQQDGRWVCELRKGSKTKRFIYGELE